MLIHNSFMFFSRFAFIKHVKTPVSNKFEDEFTFGFDELVNPLTTEGQTVVITLEESSGLVRT